MDDLNQKLSEVLNDKEMMQKVMGLASMLGGEQSGEEHTAKKESAPPSSSGRDLPASLGNTGNSAAGLSALSPEMLSTVTKLMPVFSKLNQENDRTLFLKALRPMLKPERQKKLDQAGKLLKLMEILPALRTQDFF